jgi:hypothetical protein
MLLISLALWVAPLAASMPALSQPVRESYPGQVGQPYPDNLCRCIPCRDGKAVLTSNGGVKHGRETPGSIRGHGALAAHLNSC